MAKAKVAETKAIEASIPAVKENRLTLTIESRSSLIQHKWAEKAKEQMRAKHAGRKTKERDIRDPKAEFESAMYRTEDGRHGVPVLALKAAIIGAAHKDLGVEKTLVRKALFLPCDDANGVLPMICDKPVMREDYVRVGQGSTDLRYRPEFPKWSVTFDLEYDADLLTVNDIANLINRAGFGVGLCEWRPERGGEYGRFRLASTPA
jgi:hypothetical protein